MVVYIQSEFSVHYLNILRVKIKINYVKAKTEGFQNRMYWAEQKQHTAHFNSPSSLYAFNRDFLGK